MDIDVDTEIGFHGILTAAQAHSVSIKFSLLQHLPGIITLKRKTIYLDSQSWRLQS